MNKKKVTTSLVIASIMSSNIYTSSSAVHENIDMIKKDDSTKSLKMNKVKNNSEEKEDVVDSISNKDELNGEESEKDGIDIEDTLDKDTSEDNKSEFDENNTEKDESNIDDTTDDSLNKDEINKEESENNNQEESNNNQEEYDKDNEFIEIKNTALLEAVNSQLSTNNTNGFTKKEILSITNLNLKGKGIKDLSELQNFKNLKVLDISDNKISNISILSKLSKLEKIKASNNKISDISPLNKLNLVKADFSNQKISLKKLSVNKEKFSIINPIVTVNDVKINYTISNKGTFKDNVFNWNIYNVNDNKVSVSFKGNNNEIEFSGDIHQSLSIEDSAFQNIKIEIISNSSNWINTDFVGEYSISEKYKSIIDKIELPDGTTTSNLKGEFRISKNGSYKIKVYLKNSIIIEKNINVSNIDKKKPMLKVLNKNTKDKITTFKLEASDSGSGIDYILLPNGKKVYDNKASYSVEINKNISFRVFDKAGNSYKMTIESEAKKLPVITAKNKVIHLGEKFNPLEGIRATDYKGNDITKNIIVVSNNVDIYSLGEYIVSYRVKDSNGYESTKNIIVEVIDRPQITEDNSFNNSTNSNNHLSSISNDNISEEKKVNFEKLFDFGDLDKTVYSSGILFSMIAGFRFLFKSGKDDF